MSVMQERTSPVVGVFTSDWHLSEKAPVVRSVEEDWMLAQENYLWQLREVHTKYRVPIFVAGDLLNKWNVSPLLLSWVMRCLRDMCIITIPGNHDIPNHNYGELKRSGYWTLVVAERIVHLDKPLTIGSLTIHPFPYDHEITPPSKHNGLCLQVALVHDYIWTKTTGHHLSLEEQRYPAWMKKLKGYDVVFFGDNHIPWIQSGNKPIVVNCGTFMRRAVNEINLEPSVWLLHENCTVTRHKLDCSQDKFIDFDNEIDVLEKAMELDFEEFANELKSLHSERLDFAKVVLRWVNSQKIEQPVKEIILRAIGEKYARTNR
jgi:DNA repair exonuclease SbcCD nuclease subunit